MSDQLHKMKNKTKQYHLMGLGASLASNGKKKHLIIFIVRFIYLYEDEMFRWSPEGCSIAKGANIHQPTKNSL